MGAVRRLEPEPSDPETLPSWQSRAIEAVGSVIEFWGFKRNQGRVWALLYLWARPASAAQIQSALGLSKGAVSIVTRELEQWGVITCARQRGRVQHFVAETNLMGMVGRVLRERESGVVSRACADLEAAEGDIKASRMVSPETRARLSRMLKLARVTETALEVFIKTARFNFADAMNVLYARR